MLPGNWLGPDAYPAQAEAPSACIMFSQKMTDWASTVVPSWNLHTFKLIVTVLLPLASTYWMSWPLASYCQVWLRPPGRLYESSRLDASSV